jgi:hypothetical protein
VKSLLVLGKLFNFIKIINAIIRYKIQIKVVSKVVHIQNKNYGAEVGRGC